jgi:hypothetical protein
MLDQRLTMMTDAPNLANQRLCSRRRAMRRQTVFVVMLVTSLLVLAADPCAALMKSSRCGPGVIRLMVPGEVQEPLYDLLRSQISVRGNISYGTWWDGYFQGTYYYRGDKEKLQAFIDGLEKLNHPHCRVIFIEQKGDGTERPQPAPADTVHWSVTATYIQVNDPKARRGLPAQAIANEVSIVLMIPFSHSLDHSKVTIPQRFLEYPDDRPADALHAVINTRKEN